ncbi:MAG TPA: PASTA domain-containing protein, partial [Candidatus Hydrogenedentes bacterium]|nr:PASTA domain-containing protein [Candidatus Hydrogenedentota bacterium]
QRPEADRVVRSGRRVDVVVSMGRDYLKVPDLRGMFLDEARQAIAQSRFRIGSLARVPSDAARDMVLSQDPPAGETLDAQGEINLLLSAGAASATGVMPDLRGMKVTDIPPVMAPFGVILVGNPVDVPGVPTDVVLDQSPPPDALIYPSQVVTYDYRPSGVESVPSERYEAVLCHEIPVDWYDKSIRVDVIDAMGERTTVWSREPSFTDTDRATYVAGTAIRIPVNYVRETTVEIYLNNTLHAAYRLKDGNPPEMIAYATP